MRRQSCQEEDKWLDLHSPNGLTSLWHHLFASDKDTYCENLFATIQTTRNYNKLVYILQACTSGLKTWMSNNKTKLNGNKTEAIRFPKLSQSTSILLLSSITVGTILSRLNYWNCTNGHILNQSFNHNSKIQRHDLSVNLRNNIVHLNWKKKNHWLPTEQQIWKLLIIADFTPKYLSELVQLYILWIYLHSASIAPFAFQLSKENSMDKFFSISKSKRHVVRGTNLCILRLGKNLNKEAFTVSVSVCHMVNVNIVLVSSCFAQSHLV